MSTPQINDSQATSVVCREADTQKKPSHSKSDKSPTGKSRGEPSRNGGNVVLQVMQPKPEAKEKPKVEKQKPSLTTGDTFRAMQQCLGNVSSLFMIIPVKILGLDTPALVRDHPFPDIVPIVYQFDYTLAAEEVAKSKSPFLLVRRTEIHFGNPTDTVDVLIESNLLLRCFNQSTVRDYHTLIDSIFMTVNRGLSEEMRPDFDVNTKLEAIAALYLYRHPNLTSSFQVFCRVMSQYKPRVPGVYALGGTHTPDFGECPVEVRWKRERDPVNQHYVLRLMVPELEGIVFPLYAPARTREEYLKGMAKRLKSPPRVTHRIRGIDWDEIQVAHVLHTTSLKVLRFMEHRIDSISCLSPQAVEAECFEHARHRFVSTNDQQDYMAGARIALYEDISSPDFKRLVDLCTEIGVFPKDETYDKFAPIRYIMCPEIAARGFCHALLMNAQRRLFGIDDQTHNQFCVKHMTEEARMKYVRTLFGTTPVANGDISSMESSVTPLHMNNIERVYFTRCCDPSEVAKINYLWDAYTSKRYHVSCREYEFMLDPMRLSGQEHTSAGNWVVNFTWINAIIYMLTGSYPDLSKFKIVCEGDDSLYTKKVPLESGNDYEIDPQAFIEAAESIGTKQKLATFSNVEDASFCGIKLKPSRRTLPDGKQVPDDLLDYDTDFVLSKILWKAGYDRATAKHDREIAYASILSYLPRSQGNPELYDALFWLGKKLEPTLRVTQSKHFHSIWLHTFYRGDMDEIPNIPADLESYCRKHDLPVLKFPPFYRPRVLTVPMENKYNMEIVKIEGPTVSSTWDSVLHWFRRSSTEEPVKTKVVERSTECMIYAMHEFQKATGQIKPDAPAQDYDLYRSLRFGENLQPTLTEAVDSLAVGEFLVVDTESGIEQIQKRLDGTVCRTPLQGNQPMRIVIRNNFFGNAAHAKMIMPAPPPEERRIGLGPWKMWIYPLIFTLLTLGYFCWSRVALFTVRLFDIPIYCFWKPLSVLWDRFGSAWFSSTIGSSLNVVQPLMVILGVSLAGKLFRWLTLISAIGLLLWFTWDYIGTALVFVISTIIGTLGSLIRPVISSRAWAFIVVMMFGYLLYFVFMYLL